PLGAPDVPHELFPGDHLAHVPDQSPEQVELLGGELELLVAAPGPAGLGVDPDPLHHLGLDTAAAQRRADPGQQLGQPERLGDVVVGAGVQADHRVHLVGPRGQYEHRCGAALGPKPPADLQAVELRQPQVENDQVYAAAQGTAKRARTVSRYVYVVSFTAQR